MGQSAGTDTRTRTWTIFRLSALHSANALSQFVFKFSVLWTNILVVLVVLLVVVVFSHISECLQNTPDSVFLARGGRSLQNF